MGIKKNLLTNTKTKKGSLYLPLKYVGENRQIYLFFVQDLPHLMYFIVKIFWLLHRYADLIKDMAFVAHVSNVAPGLLFAECSFRLIKYMSHQISNIGTLKKALNQIHPNLLKSFSAKYCTCQRKSLNSILNEFLVFACLTTCSASECVFTIESWKHIERKWTKSVILVRESVIY